MDPIRLLADLVAIPSVNPMGRAVSGPQYLETRMADYLVAFFDRLGVACERKPILPGRDNVIARYHAPDAAKHRVLLFDVHQDTVPVEGMTIDPFKPVISDGRLFGRGSCDIKGGMAAMLVAFARLVKERPVGSASVILACTVDEEFTHRGSSQIAHDGVRADLAVVAEPTMLNIVTCHKGAIRWKVRTRGVACHSSTPERGDNAIYRMARVVSALRAFAAELSQREAHPVLGPATLSVGRIEGGQSVNIVPDWCEVEIDRRVVPGEVSSDCPYEVRAFLQERLDEADAHEVEFLPPWVNLPALSDESSREWVGELAAVVARASGQVPSVHGVPYGTDAGPIAATGVPCVVLGPGDIAQAHTKDEWVALEQVERAAETYFHLARALGKAPPEPLLLA